MHYWWPLELPVDLRTAESRDFSLPSQSIAGRKAHSSPLGSFGHLEYSAEHFGSRKRRFKFHEINGWVTRAISIDCAFSPRIRSLKPARSTEPSDRNRISCNTLSIAHPSIGLNHWFHTTWFPRLVTSGPVVPQNVPKVVLTTETVPLECKYEAKTRLTKKNEQIKWTFCIERQ